LTSPFAVAVETAKLGLLVIQVEGDNCLIYFPNNISIKMANVLADFLQPRLDFNFSFTYEEEIFEGQNARGVVLKANEILNNSVIQSRSR